MITRLPFPHLWCGLVLFVALLLTMVACTAPQPSDIDGGSPESRTGPSTWKRKAPYLSACLLAPTCSDLLSVGHRGTIEEAPENTMAAFRKAYELGADIVEADVKLSKDGIPVVIHDGTVDRTAEAKGEVKSFTLAQLQQLKLKCPEGATCTGKERVPTLEELLRWAKGKIMIDLDMKTDNIEVVVKLVRATGTEDVAFFYLNNSTKLNQFAKVGQGLTMMPRARTEAEAEAMIQKWKPRILHTDPNSDLLTPRIQQMLKTQKIRLFLNALGVSDSVAKTRPDGYEPLLEFGGNVIQTDRLDLLVPYLTKRNKTR